MRIRIFVVAIFLSVAAVAVAGDKVVEKPVAADTPEKFAETAKLIRDDMNTGGRYEFIRPEEKAKVEADLNTMATMLQKAGSVSSMQQSEQVRLFNTQEHLNGILTHNDRNRLICERRAPVGTSIPVTTCRTLAEIEISRSSSQKMITDAGTVGDVCANPRLCHSTESEKGQHGH